jgi:uncharacterized protein
MSPLIEPPSEPLIENERLALLRLARRALEVALLSRSAVPEHQIPTALTRPGGAFVTLHKWGALRGCMGRIEALKPLHQTVQECALSAALSDPRFAPVGPTELPYLQIEISVLSHRVEAKAEEVEVGRHGLLISHGSRRALLLPQVPVEWEWDRKRFLEETCLKAGLQADAWTCGATIEVFTAQVFGEKREAALASEEFGKPA